MTSTTATPGPREGLLDVDERRVHVDLAHAGDAPASYPPGTFRKVVGAMVSLMFAVGATYFVPSLQWARPWTLDMDYVPFWNLIGRELLGEGAAAEAENAEVNQALELARTEVEKEDEQEAFVDVQVRAPADEGEKVPGYTPHEDDADKVEMPLERPESLDRFYAALTRTDLHYA